MFAKSKTVVANKAMPNARGKILIVDDEAAIRQMVCLALSQAGYRWWTEKRNPADFRRFGLTWPPNNGLCR